MGTFGNTSVKSSSLILADDNQFTHADKIYMIAGNWDSNNVPVCTISKLRVYCQHGVGAGATMKIAIYDASDIDPANWTVEATSDPFSLPSGAGWDWRGVDCSIDLTSGPKALSVIAYNGDALSCDVGKTVKTSGLAAPYTATGVFQDPLGSISMGSQTTSNWCLYAEYEEYVRGFVGWYEFNASATPENSDGIEATNLNFGNTDAVDLVPADYPIPTGSNSFFKQLVIDFSGSYTTISDMKIHKAAGNYVEGESIQFSGSVAASTPTIVDQGDPVIPTSIPATNNVAPYGGTVDDTIYALTGTIGKTSIGATGNYPALEGKLFANWSNSVVMPFDAVANIAYAYGALANPGSEDYKISVYEKGDTEATTILKGSGIGTINSTTPQWWNTPLNVLLEANKEYLITLQWDGAVGAILGWLDQPVEGGQRTLSNTNFIAPANLSGATSSSPELSFYIEYEGVSTNKTSLMRFQLLSTKDTPIIDGNQKIISFTYNRQ